MGFLWLLPLGFHGAPVLCSLLYIIYINDSDLNIEGMTKRFTGDIFVCVVD